MGVGQHRDNGVMKNLFHNIPEALPEELFETLVQGSNTSIKRIVSKGQTTDWYDQDQNEFVVVLKGAARLEFAEGRIEEMTPGDWLLIPPHTKHRVCWTIPNTETIWLAVHYGATDVAK